MRISPSKLDGLSACPCFEYVDTGATSEEGTLMHKAAETGDLSKLTDEQAAMVTHALAYVDGVIGSISTPITLDAKEVRVKMANGIKGTIDRLVVSAEGRVAHLFDYKFGRLGIPVEAKDNLQARAYTAGYLSMPERNEVDTVAVHLTAPRTQEVSSHIYKVDELDWMLKSIDEVIARAEDPFKKPDPNKDPDLCSRCANASRCPALGRALEPVSQGVSTLATAGLFKPLEEQAPIEMAGTLQLIKVFTEWADQRKSGITEKVRAGLKLPGYELRSRAGNTKIKDAVGASEVLTAVIPTRELWECASLGLTKVVSCFSKNASVSEAKAREELEVLLAPFMEQGHEITFLQKTKAKKGELSQGSP